MVGDQFESTFKYLNVSLALDEAQLCRNAAGIIKNSFRQPGQPALYTSSFLPYANQGRAAHLCFN